MRRFVAAYFRHPFTLILPAILIPLIVVFVVRSFASTYASSATIVITNSFVSISNGDSPYATPAQNLDGRLTEAERSANFVLQVAQQTDMIKTYAKGTPGVDDLMVARITAGFSITVAGAHTLTISYTDPDPHVAAEVITAYLHQYTVSAVQQAEESAQEDLQFYQEQLKTDEDTLTSADQALQQYLTQNPNADLTTDSQLAQLESAYRSALDQVNNDLTEISKINSKSNLVENLTTFIVTDPPKVPTAPTVKSKTTITAILGGVALGLGISLGLIGLLAIADRRIYSRDDLAEVMPVPVLEVVPRLRGLQDERAIVGSEANLIGFSQVPVLATLPRFGQSGPSQESGRPFSKAEEE